MATFRIPLIDIENYSAFRRVLNQLPATFDEWLFDHSQEVANIEGHGDTAQDVAVHSSEFAGYCDLTKAKRDLTNLALFVQGVAAP